MKDLTKTFQVLIRFKEPDKTGGLSIVRLNDFTNYDGLTMNSINAIDVDIKSYGYDHKLVRYCLYEFKHTLSEVLNIDCELVPYHIFSSSCNVVNDVEPEPEPIREVEYFLVGHLMKS